MNNVKIGYRFTESSLDSLVGPYVERVFSRVVFFVTPSGLKKPRGGQRMTWHRGMRKCASKLSVSHLIDWSLKDPLSRWPEADVAVNRE